MFICSDRALAIGLVFAGMLPIISSIVYFRILLNRLYSKLSSKFAYYQIFMAFLLQSANIDLSKSFIDHGLGKEASVIVKTERERFNKFSVFMVISIIFGIAVVYLFRKIIIISGVCEI